VYQTDLIKYSTVQEFQVHIHYKVVQKKFVKNFFSSFYSQNKCYGKISSNENIVSPTTKRKHLQILSSSSEGVSDEEIDWCLTCEVPLCIVPCFADYHSTAANWISNFYK